MTKTPQKTTTIVKTLIWQKYRWNHKNKQNTIETSENDRNTPKLIRNTLDFLDFGGT